MRLDCREYVSGYARSEIGRDIKVTYRQANFRRILSFPLYFPLLLRQRLQLLDRSFQSFEQGPSSHSGVYLADDQAVHVDGIKKVKEEEYLKRRLTLPLTPGIFPPYPR
jgi:hypothetical protein